MQDETKWEMKADLVKIREVISDRWLGKPKCGEAARTGSKRRETRGNRMEASLEANASLLFSFDPFYVPG